MDVIVAIIKPASAISTALPVNLLCENGVVKVQPAIVIVKPDAGLLLVSKREVVSADISNSLA
jgi:hypothetical protein